LSRKLGIVPFNRKRTLWAVVKRLVPGEEKDQSLRITPQMGILSRKKEVRSSSDPADQAIDTPAQSEGVAPESVDIPAVETVPSQPDAAPDLPVEPVEEELARVERSAEEEETEIRLKASELLGPIRQDPPDQRHEKSGSEPGTDLAEVISLANQKGGVAKTTSTLNLAVALAEMGNRVLCIDLDPQGNLTMSQGIDPETLDKSMYNVLVDDLPISEVIHNCEIDIAVASLDLAGAEIAMSTKIGRERSLERALSEVRGDYDYVCIDTPPSLGLLTINALTASNKVVVPVQCEYLSMRGLVQLQNTLKMIQDNLNPDVRIAGILPTMFDSRTLHAREAVAMLEENFGDLVFKSRIRKAVKFAEAPVRGASVLKYDPESRAASYYRNLAEEILKDGSS
jgi:chromosome partitioning protein